MIDKKALELTKEMCACHRYSDEDVKNIIEYYEASKSKGNEQPVELSDEEEDVWQIINGELAKLNLIGKTRTNAADTIWNKIRPYISEAVNIEKIAQMTSDRLLADLPEDVRNSKIELARDAIAAMGFTPVHSSPVRESVQANDLRKKYELARQQAYADNNDRQKWYWEGALRGLADAEIAKQPEREYSSLEKKDVDDCKD